MVVASDKFLSRWVLDSRFRGNDGRVVSVAPDKCRHLKSRHSLKTEIRNLKSRHSRAGGNLGLSVRKLVENFAKSPKFPPRHLGDFP
ncbi:hypothetical protein E0W41_12340 [Neisseria meningitidis]|nr:hypothetical protein [Neisseria meningitidis]